MRKFRPDRITTGKAQWAALAVGFFLLCSGCSDAGSSVVPADHVGPLIQSIDNGDPEQSRSVAAFRPQGARGCSLSSEPQSGAVEYAAGLVALLATALGLSRRLKRRDSNGVDSPAHHRDRMPSLP